MSSECDKLHAFADGELEEEEAEAFRAHLAECEACGAKLPEVLEILAAFDDAKHQRVKRRAPRASAGASGEGAPSARAERPRWRRRGSGILAGLALLGAGLAAVLLFSQPRAGKPSPFAGLPPRRPIPVRLAYPDAHVSAYREYSVERGGGTQGEVPLAAFAELERRKDWHGVAVAWLLSGNPREAERYLARLPASPAVDVDRAAAALVEGSDEGLDRALQLLDEVLTADPDNAVARWNRGLALERLRLSFTAANDLDQVAAGDEPGWREEARGRAGMLRRDVEVRRAGWVAADTRGADLAAGGEVSWGELSSAPTGIARLHLYDAIRTATSRSEVERLLPMADGLDAAGGGDSLGRYARSVAAADFKLRGPLAAAYREIVKTGRPLDPAAGDQLAARLRKRGAVDIWMGLMVWQGTIGRFLSDYEAAAAATGDPWFLAMAAQWAAKGDIQRGDAMAAERRLLAASERALSDRVIYRKLFIDLELSTLYFKMGRLPEAEARALATQEEAQTAGEWNIETDAVNRLAETTRLRYSLARARAYLREALAREPQDVPCAKSRYVHQALANVAMMELDPATARKELGAAATCGEPITILAALTYADLYRFGGTPDDAARLRHELAALRGAGHLDAAQQALVDHIEGRLLVEIDRPGGRALLRSAIDRAAAMPDDSARKARAYSFSVLALDAGRAGELGDVLALLGEELRTTVPERCAVGVAVEDERSIVVVEDAAGRVAGAYDGKRVMDEIDAATLVPADLLARLAGCEQVSVLARPPVLGSPGLLPATVAWSYRVGSTPAATRPHGGRLIVADAIPPAATGLPPLRPFVPDEGAGAAKLLRGPSATPREVLAAMRDASFIEVHAHGFIDRGLSDASYLALSPDERGRYALTAADLAHAHLDGSPVVVLAACHSGRAAPFLDEALGLPLAFIRAGAGAVVASPAAMDDRAATSFFRAVRERIDAGVSPAAAVRDARNPDSPWTGEIVVYE